MRTIPTNGVIPAPSSSFKGNPQIYWPSSDDGISIADLPHFPNTDNYYMRKSISTFDHVSPEFKNQIERATSRIWIIDSYLLKETIEDGSSFPLLEELFWNTQATDIRIISSGKGGAKHQKEKLEALAKKKTSQKNTHFNIQVSLNQNIKSLDVHDRFAIIDDELWHFGATIGGMHKQVHAISNGWSAERTQADRFYKTLWKELTENE